MTAATAATTTTTTHLAHLLHQRGVHLGAALPLHALAVGLHLRHLLLRRRQRHGVGLGQLRQAVLVLLN